MDVTVNCGCGVPGCSGSQPDGTSTPPADLPLPDPAYPGWTQTRRNREVPPQRDGYDAAGVYRGRHRAEGDAR